MYAGVFGGQKTASGPSELELEGLGRPPCVGAGHKTHQTLTRAASTNHSSPNLMFSPAPIFAISSATSSVSGFSLLCLFWS